MGREVVILKPSVKTPLPELSDYQTGDRQRRSRLDFLIIPPI